MSAIDNWIDGQTARVEHERPLAAPISRHDLGPGNRRGIRVTPLLAWAAGQPRQPSALASLAQRERRGSTRRKGTSTSQPAPLRRPCSA